ncbi:MAG: hypothetical protein IPL15_05435 [Comamonadaceae bacterium]|uniref:hypothetical protein n=1 Tax=Candidatus Skiveiella danica TaxID=3386177 RepID=UPI00390A5656|nr:hypothetical protein [Comamonadaceae bacterium]
MNHPIKFSPLTAVAVAAALLTATAAHAEMSARNGCWPRTRWATLTGPGVPEQHQPELRAREGHAERPEHPAGDPGGSQFEWNVITRTIVPIISQPAMYLGDGRTNGIGDVVSTAFPLAGRAQGPDQRRRPSWNQLPTDSNGLGNKNWGPDASFVVLKLVKANPGSRARWSTTSGRSPATSEGAATITA